MPAQLTRILIESTSTFSTPITTGIQRVVRSIVREVDRTDSDASVECVPVVFRGGYFYDASKAWRRVQQRESHGESRKASRFLSFVQRFPPTTGARASSALARLRKLFNFRTLRRWLSHAYWHTMGERIAFQPRDVLLLLDETWNLPLWPAVDQARRHGCRVGSVVYDLVPLDYPHFFKERFAAAFRDWLTTLTDHADFFVTISESVRRRLQSHLADCDQDSADCLETFRLGADFPKTGVRDHVRPVLKELFADEGHAAPYLSVGTLEPRKNHDYLLDAFELLWRRFPSARLCLVGRVGWKCDHLIERIRNHPRLNTSLFWFHDISDGELHYCYQRARGLVSVSIAEGFGLPIVEALVHGLPVFASDIPVHHEVGGGRCCYFDLKAASSLTGLLQDAEHNGGPAKQMGQGTGVVIPWSESWHDLLTKTMRLQARACGTRPITELGRSRRERRLAETA
jgi:glycosyltransferase involved in cell wall biosynthesis